MMAKKIMIIIVFVLTMMQPVAALAGDNILFTSIPEGLDLVVGESVDFNVILKNNGAYSDVCIQSRNISDGITVEGINDYKLMDMGNSVTYPLTLSADKNAKPGIYTFEIADSSDSDFSTWTTIKLAILNVSDSPVFNIIKKENGVDEEIKEVIPEINEKDAIINETEVSGKTEYIIQKDEDSGIVEVDSDSIMNNTVTLTYSELLISLIILWISITIINLVVVSAIGIARERKREKSIDAIDDDIAYEDNKDDNDDDNDGGSENEDYTE